MKKVIAVTMSSIMLFQSLAFATKSETRQLRDRVDQMRIQDMSLNELQDSLEELRGKLAILHEDLMIAEKQDGDRLAIKVRNGLAITAGAAVVYNYLRAGSQVGTADARMGNAVALFIFGGLGIVAVGATQGYIYVTRSEIREMKEAISVLEDKVIGLKAKIERRKAGL